MAKNQIVQVYIQKLASRNWEVLTGFMFVSKPKLVSICTFQKLDIFYNTFNYFDAE